MLNSSACPACPACPDCFCQGVLCGAYFAGPSSVAFHVLHCSLHGTRYSALSPACPEFFLGPPVLRRKIFVPLRYAERLTKVNPAILLQNYPTQVPPAPTIFVRAHFRDPAIRLSGYQTLRPFLLYSFRGKHKKSDLNFACLLVRWLACPTCPDSFCQGVLWGFWTRELFLNCSAKQFAPFPRIHSEYVPHSIYPPALGTLRGAPQGEEANM